MGHDFREKLWKRIKRFLKKSYYLGQRLGLSSNARNCPICGFWGTNFESFGNPVRQDARCPGCGSLERHRFAWLLLHEKTDLFKDTNKKVLHVAPEACFEERLRSKLKENYLTADLLNPKAMVKMDITDIDFPDESFGAVICSHVLEHVLDDRKAMSEFFRVLTPGGWGLLDVPIAAAKTYEDETIVESKDRLLAFGQEDHVRKYGPDYIDRLKLAGFDVTAHTVSNLVSKDLARKTGILPLSRSTFLCFKPLPATQNSATGPD